VNIHSSRISSLVLAIAVASLAGCAGAPIDPARIDDPALARIQAEFERIVAEAHADPDVEWTYGWAGNSAAKAAGDGSVRGLCYEWEELIHPRILPVCKDVGWEASGITLNFGWFSEHHSVVVWDPARVARDELLDTPDSAWVLDAWQRAQADVYRLSDWLDLPWIVFEPAHLEEVGPLE